MNHPEETTVVEKSWLQRLKEESWEAELLVSTISIYGTFQLFGFIDWATNIFINLLNPEQYLIGYFIVFSGLLAVSILVSMFVIHFFLRAYWIGLVGLNSVFPDYSLEDSAYSKIYTEKMLRVLPRLKDSIDKVDELCSVIFSAAFTLLLLYSYVGITISLYLLFYNLLDDYVPHVILLIPAAIMVLATFIQTLFSIIANLKVYQSNEKVQTLYFHVVRIGSIISFGPLYKSISQVFMIFGTNFKKKRSIVYLILSFLLAGVLLSANRMLQTNIPHLFQQGTGLEKRSPYYNYYQNENADVDFLLTPVIESDVVESDVLKVFIPVYSHERSMREAVCEDVSIDSAIYKVDKLEAERAKIMQCYKTYNLIYLNNTLLRPEFRRHEHMASQQVGLMGYIDVSEAKKGLNTLTVVKDFGDDNNRKWEIPFYYLPE